MNVAEKKSDFNDLDFVFQDDDLVPQYRKIQKEDKRNRWILL